MADSQVITVTEQNHSLISVTFATSSSLIARSLLLRGKFSSFSKFDLSNSSMLKLNSASEPSLKRMYLWVVFLIVYSGFSDA